MDTKARAELVRSIRVEMKQRRRPPAQLTPQEERDRGDIQLMNRNDRRRPVRQEGTSYADHQAATLRYHQDRSRRGGFNEGERLRAIHESGAGSRERGSVAADRMMRRMNVRFQSRTGFSGPNGVEVTLTPTERVNRVGVASRRRHVSPGLVPAPVQPRRR